MTRDDSPPSGSRSSSISWRDRAVSWRRADLLTVDDGGARTAGFVGASRAMVRDDLARRRARGDRVTLGRRAEGVRPLDRAAIDRFVHLARRNGLFQQSSDARGAQRAFACGTRLHSPSRLPPSWRRLHVAVAIAVGRTLVPLMPRGRHGQPDRGSSSSDHDLPRCAATSGAGPPGPCGRRAPGTRGPAAGCEPGRGSPARNAASRWERRDRGRRPDASR